MNSLPLENVIWGRSRDSVNMVMGGILGGFLGLTISRQGLQQGTYFDLFALLTLNAFAVIQILEAGNRYFEGMRWLSFVFFFSSLLTIWTSMAASRQLGINETIVATIYGSWIFMIVVQISCYEAANLLKKHKND